MTPERWEQVKALFRSALERDAGIRAAFLTEACGEDAQLRSEVEALLASHEDTGRLLGAPVGSPPEVVSVRGDAGSLKSGSRLGPYEVISLAGAGGMGEVYRARDSRLGREVAVKVLPARTSSDPQSLRRFEQEARAAGALNHPNILDVHDVGTHEGTPYVVSELLEGETLRGCLAAGGLPASKAVDYGVQIARGLAAAHEKGIAHRDLKPDNIFVTQDGRIKILDFGLAKLRDPSPASAETTPEKTLTQTEPGLIMGTVGYIAPEQLRGLAADHRSDIFAFGAVLYEMLTGEKAFRGESAADVLSAVLKNEPDFAGTGRTIPPALAVIVQRCLEKRPGERFQSAHDIALALQAVTSVTELRPRELEARSGRLALVAGVAVALAATALVLYYWHRDPGPAPAPVRSGVKALAVLPFENLGPSDEEYFADGMTDEVRGKLAGLPGLVVIASHSSNQYKKTTKAPAQIASELGVQYLLVGKVRWQKRKDGESRVRVSPELVEAASASTKWQQPFDAVLTDVFEVQATIATQVAQALDVALGQSEREQLAEKPTANLKAYEAYLQGNEARQGFAAAADIRQAVAHYERAVALDPGFALAWAELSRARTYLYAISVPSAAIRDQARVAAERALALAPDLPAARFALGSYQSGILRDWSRALEQFAAALQKAPRNAELLAEISYVRAATGRWEEALVSCRQAQRIDPRSALTARRLTETLLFLRRYPEALEAADRALALAPQSPDPIEHKAMVFLAQGQLARAQGVLKAAPRELDPTTLVAYVASYWDLFWLLDDEQQQLLMRLTPGPFGDDRLAWALALAQTAEVRRDAARVRQFAEEARAAAEAQLVESPLDPQRHVLLGLALAYLGRKSEALREGERGVALLPPSHDARDGAYFQHQLARIYRRVGETEKALDLLQGLLEIPYTLSPGWLRIDPEWTSLRDHPRFKKLSSGSDQGGLEVRASP